MRSRPPVKNRLEYRQQRADYGLSHRPAPGLIQEFDKKQNSVLNLASFGVEIGHSGKGFH
jgi:hypothetical protein